MSNINSTRNINNYINLYGLLIVRDLIPIHTKPFRVYPYPSGKYLGAKFFYNILFKYLQLFPNLHFIEQSSIFNLIKQDGSYLNEFKKYISNIISVNPNSTSNLMYLNISGIFGFRIPKKILVDNNDNSNDNSDNDNIKDIKIFVNNFEEIWAGNVIRKYILINDDLNNNPNKIFFNVFKEVYEGFFEGNLSCINGSGKIGLVRLQGIINHISSPKPKQIFLKNIIEIEPINKILINYEYKVYLLNRFFPLYYIENRTLSIGETYNNGNVNRLVSPNQEEDLSSPNEHNTVLDIIGINNVDDVYSDENLAGQNIVEKIIGFGKYGYYERMFIGVVDTISAFNKLGIFIKNGKLFYTGHLIYTGTNINFISTSYNYIDDWAKNSIIFFPNVYLRYGNDNDILSIHKGEHNINLIIDRRITYPIGEEYFGYGVFFESGGAGLFSNNWIIPSYYPLLIDGLKHQLDSVVYAIHPIAYQISLDYQDDLCFRIKDIYNQYIGNNPSSNKKYFSLLNGIISGFPYLIFSKSNIVDYNYINPLLIVGQNNDYYDETIRAGLKFYIGTIIPSNQFYEFPKFTQLRFPTTLFTKLRGDNSNVFFSKYIFGSRYSNSKFLDVKRIIAITNDYIGDENDINKYDQIIYDKYNHFGFYPIVENDKVSCLFKFPSEDLIHINDFKYVIPPISTYLDTGIKVGKVNIFVSNSFIAGSSLPLTPKFNRYFSMNIDLSEKEKVLNRYELLLENDLAGFDEYGKYLNYPYNFLMNNQAYLSTDSVPYFTTPVLDLRTFIGLHKMNIDILHSDTTNHNNSKVIRKIQNSLENINTRIDNDIGKRRYYIIGQNYNNLRPLYDINRKYWHYNIYLKQSLLLRYIENPFYNPADENFRLDINYFAGSPEIYYDIEIIPNSALNVLPIYVEFSFFSLLKGIVDITFNNIKQLFENIISNRNNNNNNNDNIIGNNVGGIYYIENCPDIAIEIDLQGIGNIISNTIEELEII